MALFTASPRGQCSKLIQNLEGKACSDEKPVPVTWSVEQINSMPYISPVGD